MSKYFGHRWRESALTVVRDGDYSFQVGPPTRAPGDVLGDFFGERGDVNAVAEPDSFLDGDVGSIGKSEAPRSRLSESRLFIESNLFDLLRSGVGFSTGSQKT